jgi:hypothetical protein
MLGMAAQSFSSSPRPGARRTRHGSFGRAEFTDPQGLLFLDEGTLLAADAGNHL